MRTRAIRWPPTSKRRARPGPSSSVRHSATVSGTRSNPPAVLAQGGVESCVHFALEQGGRLWDGPPVDDGVEEAPHDESLCHFGCHTTRLDVVALVFVDGSHG